MLNRPNSKLHLPRLTRVFVPRPDAVIFTVGRDGRRGVLVLLVPHRAKLLDEVLDRICRDQYFAVIEGSFQWPSIMIVTWSAPLPPSADGIVRLMGGKRLDDVAQEPLLLPRHQSSGTTLEKSLLMSSTNPECVVGLFQKKPVAHLAQQEVGCHALGKQSFGPY